MAERADWSKWPPWQELWVKWTRLKPEKDLGLSHIQFIDLFNFFQRQIKALGIDPYTVDVEAYLDSTLTYEENRTILAELMKIPPTTTEYEAMYESYKAELIDQVKEKYPEVWAEFEKRIKELERETERLPRVERERAKFKKLAESLRYELEETERRREQEKSALEKRVAPVKLRILKGFREGIIDYTAGSVVETRDIDWAMGLVEKGLAERVAFEVPVEIKPPPIEVKPPPKVPPPDREKKLTDVFYAVLDKHRVPITTALRSRWRLELPSILMALEAEQELLAEKFAMELVREHEARKPPPRVPVPPPERPLIRRDLYERYLTGEEFPPEWKKVVGGYLTPRGEFISEEQYPTVIRKILPPTRFIPLAKPPGLNLKDWLRWQHGLDWGDFLKLSDPERKILLDEYERLSRERT